MKNKLNQEQKMATEHGRGPCMILAGPGTGKTTIIVSRLKYLIEEKKVNPKSIVILTFSKNAAIEMENRFNIASKNKYEKVLFGTFHSVFFKQLKKYKDYDLSNFLDDKVRQKIIISIIKNIDISLAEDYSITEEIANEISFLDNTIKDISTYEAECCRTKTFMQIYNNYVEYKKCENKFDFDDMLTGFYKMILQSKTIREDIQKRFQYIMIDEFQDINILQYEIIKILSGESNNVLVVGDDDQCIYSFRGSMPAIFNDFEKYYKDLKLISLKINYRSTKNIIRAAKKLIINNKNRYDKEIVGNISEDGVNILTAEMDNIERESDYISDKIKVFQERGISLNDIAILYRNNMQARAVIDSLASNNIAYECHEGLQGLFNSWVYVDIKTYLSLGIEKKNSYIARIINKPNRYISKTIIDTYFNEEDILKQLSLESTLNKLQISAIIDLENHIAKLKGLKPAIAINYIRKHIGYDSYIKEYAKLKGVKSKGLMEILDEIQNSAKRFNTINEFLLYLEILTKDIQNSSNKNSKKETVKLMTIHKSKGLEFQNVFIIGCIEGIIPANIESKEKNIEEERRLFYVAMTRAKKELIMTIPKNRNDKTVKKSRFIEELIK